MKRMTKLTAMKKFVETRELSTAMLPALGISMDAFLKFAQLNETVAKGITDRLVAKFSRAIEADKVMKKAERALRAGDIDEAFDLGLKAANIADGLE